MGKVLTSKSKENEGKPMIWNWSTSNNGIGQSPKGELSSRIITIIEDDNVR